MKRSILFLILWLLALAPPAAAQSSDVDRLFKRYTERTDQGFTLVEMERPMLRMLSRQAADQGDKTLAELLKNIEAIRVLSLGVGHPDDGKERAGVCRALYDSFLAEAQRVVSRRRSVTLRQSGADEIVSIHMDEMRDKRELLMLTCNSREATATLVYVYGKFDLENVLSLASIAP